MLRSGVPGRPPTVALVYGDVAFAASVFLLIGAIGHLISRSGVEVVYAVPIDVVTEVALSLGIMALSVSALVATACAGLADGLGIAQSVAWGLGSIVAVGLLALWARRFGLRLLTSQSDYVTARRRSRKGLPPLPEGPTRHAR
jgi:hypothetical protein